MSFTCKNAALPFHQHEKVYDARVCWGFIRPVQPVTPVRPYDHQPITPRQLNYVKLLGGDEVYAAKLSKDEAITYIDKLKKEGHRVSTPATDPRLELLDNLIDRVPDGYYATEAAEGDKLNFLRISRPKFRRSGKNVYAGAVKIQTQHGPRLEVAGAQWPKRSDETKHRWSIYDSRVVDMLMLLVVDSHGCAMRYARKLNHCCRCNTELTDPRSRHYGIGPECEKYRPTIIELVDELHDGKSYEQLARR